MFFNERDIAYLRINELYDSVDYFIVNEATKTHLGQPKELIFWKDERLQQFKDKIIYSPIDLDGRFNKQFTEMFRDGIKGAKEHEQRIRLLEQIETLNLSDDDIIMVSDCDEIPNKNLFKDISNYAIVGLNQLFFVHYINVYTNKNVIGTICCKYKNLKELNQQSNNMALQILRENKDYLPRLENGGWHYSYMGGAKTVSQKVISIYEGSPDSPWKTEEASQKLIDESLQNKKSPFSDEPIVIIDFKRSSLCKLNFITAISGQWIRHSAQCELHPKWIERDFNGHFTNLVYNNYYE
jgi:beta-1,4-mannosyl-glycoprotein beta-1,4-N-acetylglucosaminyltransferase